MTSEPEPCVHSYIEPRCASCWYGQARRCEAENVELRRLIVDYGDRNVIAALDAWDERHRGSTVTALMERLRRDEQVDL